MRFSLSLSAAVLAAVCLVANAGPIGSKEIAKNVAKGLRLLSLQEGAEPVWKTENEVLDLLRAGVNFVCG